MEKRTNLTNFNKSHLKIYVMKILRIVMNVNKNPIKFYLEFN